MSKKQYIYIVILLSFCVSSLQAQESSKPVFQLEDNTFFDPDANKEVKEQYEFGVEYRIEAGFQQDYQRAQNISFPDLYLNGARLGATFTFKLPFHFNLQTGLLYTLLYGRHEQHWRSLDVISTQTEYIHHRVLAHNLTVPVRVFYIIPVWKELNLFFYTGPQLHIGMAQNDYLERHLSEGAYNWLKQQGLPTDPYDRLADELVRANIQWGVGGGLEWDRYRLQSGYDFGLNNLVKHKQTPNQYMSEWGWYGSFSYQL